MEGLLRKLVSTPDQFTPKDARDATNRLMLGVATHSQTASFLTALKCHSLDVDPKIVAACAQAIEEQAIKVELKLDNPNEIIVDIVGTGGDGWDTFNASTAAGIIVAGSGVKVAKVNVVERSHSNQFPFSSFPFSLLLFSFS